MVPALSAWTNFYVIVGSAAGALVGLQFVVLTLIAQIPGPRTAEAGAAFSTPTVVHFMIALFLAGVGSAPWQSIRALSWIWILSGLTGITYSIFVARRMRAQDVYVPVFEDWLFHALLPMVLHSLLIASAYWARSNLEPALFVIGAIALLFLFVGIHNAWDAVIWHVFVRSQQPE